MKVIVDWKKKSLVCSTCGETRSVKYEDDNGNSLCNLCAFKQIGDDEATLDDYRKEASESM